MVQQQPSASPSASAPKEGFWGRVNPFARKKWVNNRVDPLRGQLNELDEVNAKNSHDIRDVDSRAQAGIHHAQSSADEANQTALNAENQAQNANATAKDAAGHVDRLHSTVDGLDQYHQASEVEVRFHDSNIPASARRQLDEFAASLNGRQGYVLEIEGYSPLAGGNGIQSSRRLAEAVKRYLVVEHEIPVYRLHSVALGNAPFASSDSEESKPVKASCVRIRLMENTLAATEDASPHDTASVSGAGDRP